MPGFNVVPPNWPPLTSADLAQLGLAAFRPPGPMAMPALPSAPLGPAPSFAPAQNSQLLASILDALKGNGGANGGGIANLEEAALPDFLSGASLLAFL